MSLPISPTVFMGLYFFPRGGSAQVARYLCRALRGSRWEPTLFAGSIGAFADSSNAEQFFSGIRCEALDYTSARSRWSRGADAMTASVPISASYEDKGDVADRIFLDLDDAAFDRQVKSWARFLTDRATTCPSLVHLHHLTPMHEAVRSVWPGVPIVTHLHGTELKMLAAVDDISTVEGPWRWEREWVERMRGWAAGSDRVVVVGQHDEQMVQQVLPVEAWRVTTIANGVDTGVFAPRVRPPTERLELWKRWLVDEPRGWSPGCSPGSIRYTLGDLAGFVDDTGRSVPVVLFTGRFLRFKRLQLLIEAHHAMRSTSSCRSVLVIVGGFPAEWEDEHPYDTVQRLHAEGVFFVGWRDHDELAEALNCSDVFAAPSVDEPFGLVYLEAMASGIPPIATRTGGPLSFINLDPDQPTGWLVPPDDCAATTRALIDAVSDATERIKRGARAAVLVGEHYSWVSSAAAFARIYDALIDEPTRSNRSAPALSTRVVA
jgi:glycosyltransferase involved in cell wall biosynthesis